MLGTLCCPGSLSCPVPSLSLAWRQFQLSKFGRHLSWLSDVCYTHCCRVMRTRYSRISMTVLCTLCCQKIKLCRLNKRTAAKESHIMYRSFWEGCPLARNVFWRKYAGYYCTRLCPSHDAIQTQGRGYSRPRRESDYMQLTHDKHPLC
jgi:hypothetical protein